MRMKQQTLAMAADQGAGFEQYRRPTKRDVFVETMEQIVPWTQLCEVIEPHYPKGQGGRPPIGLERMHFVQHWFNLAMKPARKRFWAAPHCGDSLGLTWGASACLMARRC
jgi:hypothetical protein